MHEEPTAYRVPDPGVRALFAEESRYQAWLDVEAALAQAQAELGMIPPHAAEEITQEGAARAAGQAGDPRRAGERTGHWLVPLIWELDRVCEGDAGGYVHWGATTQNITQTGQFLLTRRAHAIFLRQLATLLEAWAARRARQGHAPAGTHARPARAARHVRLQGGRLDRRAVPSRRAPPRRPRAASSSPCSAAARARWPRSGRSAWPSRTKMAERLGMTPMPVPARTIGDHQAEYVRLLGLLAATCSKIGREVYTLMKQEFGEVEEPVPPGTVGSSTMPQKRNPKLSQDIVAAAAQVRALVPLALEAMQTEHEADRTTSVMFDRAITEACILTGDILERLIALFSGLTVFPERMRQNLDLSGGLIMSEALMLELGTHIGRQRAHDVVYDAAQAASREAVRSASCSSRTRTFAPTSRRIR